MTIMRCMPAVICLLLCSTLAIAQSRIGIANPVRIFGEIQETKDLRSKLDNDRRQLEATEKEKRGRLETLQQQREQLKPDAPQYAEITRQLEAAAIELQVWLQVSQVNFQRTQKLQMKMIFDKIIDGIGEVAAGKQLELVLSDQRPELPDNLDQINLDQLRVLLNQRNVLYNDAKIDISADVINHLDAKYRAGN